MANRHRRGNSFSESSEDGLSSDDDATTTVLNQSIMQKGLELTLKDDENTIKYQAPPPEDDEELGESDDDRRIIPRTNQSSASGTLVDEIETRKQHSAKKKRKRVYYICLSMCKYECVRRAAKKLNFREVGDDDDWTIYWTDTSVGIDRVAQMKKWQKINHFPGMSEICRKDSLTRNMTRMYKMFPKDYAFYPRAWCLPADYSDFAKFYTEKKHKTYISKPDVGCQGRGIFITKNPAKDIKPGDNFVVQVYVNRPLVIDGFKFDLRVYVAVTSCDPFRIFVYKDGLARFTTQQYEEPSHINCKDIYMHLTNYAIQKRSEDFVRDEDSGTKRRITTINRWLVDNGKDIVKLWADIDDVIIKVLISAHSVLKHNYRACFPNHYRGSACFEILGFDILLDRKLRPYVLEVNHSPSFTTDSKLDREIKDALIYDTILLLNLPAADKRRFIEEEKKRAKERLFQKINKKDNKYREVQEDLAQQWQKEIEKWEDQHMGNYRRIYPAPETAEKYDRFYTQSGTLYSETAASKARLEQAKAQIDELQKKQDKLNAFKNRKSNSSLSNPYNKEVGGESPHRKPLVAGKSRSSSMNRTPLRQLTAKNTAVSSPVQNYGDSLRPIDIDEEEERERRAQIQKREMQLTAMGVIELCYRELANKPGTTANVIVPSNPPKTAQTAPQNATIDIDNLSQNFSLLDHINSKALATQNGRFVTGTGIPTTVLPQYAANQQQTSTLLKYDSRAMKNATIFTQGTTKNGRYQQQYRTVESIATPSNRIRLGSNAVPALTTTVFTKTTNSSATSGLESSIRTKSANMSQRQRTGGLCLVACDLLTSRLSTTIHPSSEENLLKPNISVNGCAITTRNKFTSVCDFTTLEQFKRIHLAALANRTKLLSTSCPPTPK